MTKVVRIGTRDSQLAVWQATWVQELLKEKGVATELVYIKSEGDIDLVTPLYEIGVQGIFTKTLDAALLSNKIDIAVHSMKDVPTQLAKGIREAAVLKRASHKDILVYKDDHVPQALGYVNGEWSTNHGPWTMDHGLFATSSVRRKAQWLNRYPDHQFDNLRGNVNTRLRKLEESNWQGAIFAAAGLERINLRPEKAIDLDWMLPAPAQGAVMVVCREGETEIFNSCQQLHHNETAICAHAERNFLRQLMGGCATPISALAQIQGDEIFFKGNVVSLDGREKVDISTTVSVSIGAEIGTEAGQEILAMGAAEIIQAIRNAGK
ncbi:MAG: hydroxymethylbilane synthase [Sediminibacterium sp. Gen4]|jgi:hydroxymethylbilane synthase|uniref:hydroxymethylbilane synthase n=1 Tax=unclassified Sediminibacterium TaxID=2635961 RepID=UPI0015BE5FB5|nr:MULTISPECIES: hydroxymethylbilane synthase [unclassified Sediminibacterium]MBW0159796.1 hydroxymethylbilane synthase [Sediminibacterium sp.]MBW0165510.1 hydroxymethylbilane synthase [Sediminibacterium sp.]NWK64842.1 hydroxymethylbilane synthase [Sediminibacterium sp. Gen4]